MQVELLYDKASYHVIYRYFTGAPWNIYARDLTRKEAEELITSLRREHPTK